MRKPLIWVASALLFSTYLWGARQIYVDQISEIRHRAQEQLQTIARLKVDQVVAWRKERQSDGEVLRNNANLVSRLIRWLDSPADADTPGVLQNALAEFQRQYGYQDHWLVDERKQVRIHNGSIATGTLSTDVQSAIDEAERSRHATLSEIYLSPQASYPLITLAVPLFQGEKPAGSLLLDIDVRQTLYPLIKTWPVPSESAEALMVRRDGNDALFLNELRHVPNAALARRIPLTQTSVPAVQAVLGKTGLIEGQDYRGVPVISVGLQIPDTSWELLAKVDRAEIYAEARREALFLGGWLLSLLALMGILPTLLWQRHKWKLEEQLNRAELAQLESLKEFQNLFEQSTDGILLLTHDHRFLDANQAALELLGYRLEELKALRLADALAPHERARLDRDVPEMMAGKPHRGEWVCRRRDGTMFIAESTAKALDQSRYFAYFRDITRSKQAEQALRESEERYQLANEATFNVIWDWDLHAQTLWWNPNMQRLLGWKPDALQPGIESWTDRIHPDDQARVESGIHAAMDSSQHVWSDEYRFLRGDGTYAEIEDRCVISRDITGKALRLVGAMRDITERKLAEQALRVEANLREQLSQFAETVPGVVYVYQLRPDGTGDCPYMSPRVAELYGVTAEQAAEDAQFMIDRVHPEDLEAFLASIRVSANELSPWQAEFRILHPNRGVIWLEAMSTPRAEADGTIVWHGFLFDITQRKLTEQTLRLSQFTLESASESVYWIRPDSTFFYVNDAACTMLGYSRDQLMRMGVTDLDADYQEVHWREHFDQLKQEGSIRLETTHRAQDGRVIPVEVSANFITFEGNEYTCAIVRDITERKRVEKAIEAYQRELEERVAERTRDLSTSEERFRLAMQATSDGLWDWNLRTGECYYSPAYFKMLGFDSGDWSLQIGTWIELMHPDEREAILAREDELLSSVGKFELDFRLRHRQGHYIWVTSRGQVVERDADGKPLRAVGTHVDITEHRQTLTQLEDLNRNLEKRVEQRTAQLAAASAAKSQFLAHMSHELRTPMNAVLGFAQLLEREPLRPDELAMVKNIRESGDSLLHIINDILDFSKIEAGQLRLDRQPFALSEVLSRVEHLLHVSAETKGLALKIQQSPIDLGVLVGDPLRVEQILINLIGNAIKFTQKGSVTLSVRPMTHDEVGVRVRFEVQDTGIGIAPHLISKLFLPFSQADDSITRNFGGTGLGLAISRRLVDLMGGEMGLDSEVGQGSTFWFELTLDPAVARKPALEVAEPGATLSGGPQLTGLRVLAVDDSRINLMLVERALTREGAIVSLGADGQQALNILNTQPQSFDVVLMDVQMPVMDGLTATREIRKNPDLAHLPVFALTAGVLPEERQAALDAGVNGFIAKPIDLEQLKSELGKCRPVH